ncbi:MAG: ribosome maturation factor RimM, partial [Longimicrobiales bacterium]
DYPESTFAPGVVLHLGDSEGNLSPGVDMTTRIETSRGYRKGFLIRFEGHEGRSEAEALRGRYLLRPLEDVRQAEEGEVFYHQLLGMRVTTVDGRVVGEVAEVYEIKPADLLEVRGAEGTVLIPFIAEFIQSVDTEEGVIVVDPPAGLLDD